MSAGPRYASDASGVAAHPGPADLAGAGWHSPDELYALAVSIVAVEKCAAGARVVSVHDDTLEGAAIAKMVTGGAFGPRVAASVQDRPGLAAALEAGGAHVWRVHTPTGPAMFASNFPPAAHAGLEPLSKHADFPAAVTRAIKFVGLRKDDEAAADVLPDKQIVYGIVLEPETVDSQGDIYSASEIEASAHRYLEEFQNVGHMHQALINQSAKVVESYLAPCDFTMGGQAVKVGTWVIAFHVLNAKLWEQIKSGSLTGFSIGGYAQRIPIDGSGPATVM